MITAIGHRCIQCNSPFVSCSVGDDLCSTECEDNHRAFIAKFNGMKKTAKWLAHPNEIKSAENESLVRSLCTADGRGSDFKRKALAELIVRAKMEAFGR